jgi:glycerate kinase
VARLALGQKKPVLGITGSMAAETDVFLQMGFTSVIPIADRPMSTEQSMEEAGRLIVQSVERTFRIMELGKVLRY